MYNQSMGLSTEQQMMRPLDGQDIPDFAPPEQKRKKPRNDNKEKRKEQDSFKLDK